MSSIAHAGEPLARPGGRTLSDHQKQLVRQSFTRLEPAVELVVRAFYARLFEIAPEVEPLFAGEMAEQRRKLTSALQLAVASLDKLEELAPTLKLLGVKHREHGVDATHYGAVGEALLWTLREALEDAFDAETHDAWAAVYTHLAEVMCSAD